MQFLLGHVVCCGAGEFYDPKYKTCNSYRKWNYDVLSHRTALGATQGITLTRGGSEGGRYCGTLGSLGEYDGKLGVLGGHLVAHLLELPLL